MLPTAVTRHRILCPERFAPPACTSHQSPAAAADVPHPAAFSRFGVLDVLSSTTPRPARPGQGPEYRPLRAPWPWILGAVTTAISFISEERQRRSGGHGAATLRADGGRGRSLRCLSSKMHGHRLPPRALISAREPHRRTLLGTLAGPLSRKRRWARHLAALELKTDEKCRLDVVRGLSDNGRHHGVWFPMPPFLVNIETSWSHRIRPRAGHRVIPGGHGCTIDGHETG